MMTDQKRYKNERGNVLFMILIAIVLIGALTAAVMNTSQTQNAAIDNETLAVRVSEIQRFAGEIERGVLFISQNGFSENDMRFAHPDAPSDYGDLSGDTTPGRQIFHPSGGGANYKLPPKDVNDGSPWEFYGGTALPSMGSSRADLVAVLPAVTKQVCDKINALNGQPTTPPNDTGASLAGGSSPGNCVSMGGVGRFRDAQQFYATPNTTDETTFTQDPETSGVRPAPEACVYCAADGKYHFYHVIMAR
jgi:hypothetical protein